MDPLQIEVVSHPNLIVITLQILLIEINDGYTTNRGHKKSKYNWEHIIKLGNRDPGYFNKRTISIIVVCKVIKLPNSLIYNTTIINN